MTMSNISLNGSEVNGSNKVNGFEDIQSIEHPFDQDGDLQLADSDETALTLSSEDIEAESVAISGQPGDIPSSKSTLTKSLIDLPHSGKSLAQNTGKRAFAIANRMAQATDVENLYQIAVAEIRKRFKVERSLIYRFQSETQGTVIAESLSAGYRPMLGESAAAIAFGASSAMGYKQQPSVAISDAAEAAVTPHQMQLFNQYQVRASLSLPIFLEGQLWGLLVMQQCSAARQWSEHEISFLYLVATELQVNLQPLGFQSGAIAIC